MQGADRFGKQSPPQWLNAVGVKSCEWFEWLVWIDDMQSGDGHWGMVHCTVMVVVGVAVVFEVISVDGVVSVVEVGR